MDNQTNSLAFMETVAASYKQTNSLKKTGEEFGIAYAKVRKILITLGEYETDFSIRVNKAYGMGMSVEEIADLLGTSKNRVSAHLPYVRVLYDSENETHDAAKSKLYRERIQKCFENFVAHKANKKNMLRPTEQKITKSVTSTFDAVHIRLELKSDWLSDEDIRTLVDYGGATSEGTFVRDLLVPSDIHLHQLHYAIQKAFGWQNSHLRSFTLPKDVYDRVTGGSVRGWVKQVGVLFQPPSEFEGDVFWDDDYERGSIKTWLQDKYTGPYEYGGHLEHYKHAQEDVMALVKQFPFINVQESFDDYYERTKDLDDKEIKIIKKAPLIDLTIDELNQALILETGTDYLLERLQVTDLLAPLDLEFSFDGNLPLCQHLNYVYDFGDHWTVEITSLSDINQLETQGTVSASEIKKALTSVLETHRPVCIHQRGLPVMDDVGGLSGFAEFLEKVYNNKDGDEVDEYLTWARSMGWSKRKVSNRLLL